MLIGAIVLEDLNLLVDSRTQQLRPRDPEGIVTEIAREKARLEKIAATAINNRAHFAPPRAFNCAAR